MAVWSLLALPAVVSAAASSVDGVCSAEGRRTGSCEAIPQQENTLLQTLARVDKQSLSEGGFSGQYGHMTGAAVDEGNNIGSVIRTSFASDCQRSCDRDANCKSFTLCPEWAKCWMKDRTLTGGEPTHQMKDCTTYYKKSTSLVPGAPAPSSPRTIKVMSYNTEYKNYNARMSGYARKIREIAPAIVGLQECQNRDGLAQLSGYMANKETGRQNYMIFDPSKVTLLSGGWMRIPRDEYADRAITWGKFSFGGRVIWFFNTHLPHNHGEARSMTTHARIAEMLLRKRRELGAENAPTIVVGDMNSHASNFNKVAGGGFESNLKANGFVWAYTAKGHPGHPGIDHLLYSAAHWTHSGCGDTGTGGSDHTSITCDLTLK